jgi:hypothetical protein
MKRRILDTVLTLVLAALTVLFVYSRREHVEERVEIVLRCPTKDAAFAPGDVIPLKAEVRGFSPGAVEFTSDGKILARDNTPPFAATFRPALGSYILTAQARDRQGRLVQSPRVLIYVRALDIAYDEMDSHDVETAMGVTDKDAPTAALVSPASGTVLCHPSSVQFVAAINAVRSPVVRVEFLVDGVPIGIRTAAPFAFVVWKHPSIHRHTASVRVFAADGRVGTSSRVNLLIID